MPALESTLSCDRGQVSSIGRPIYSAWLLRQDSSITHGLLWQRSGDAHEAQPLELSVGVGGEGSEMIVLHEALKQVFTATSVGLKKSNTTVTPDLRLIPMQQIHSLKLSKLRSCG